MTGCRWWGRFCLRVGVRRTLGRRVIACWQLLRRQCWFIWLHASRCLLQLCGIATAVIMWCHSRQCLCSNLGSLTSAWRCARRGVWHVRMGLRWQWFRQHAVHFARCVAGLVSCSCGPWSPFACGILRIFGPFECCPWLQICPFSKIAFGVCLAAGLLVPSRRSWWLGWMLQRSWGLWWWRCSKL